MRTKLLTTLALLLMAVSGVWAQTSGECGDGVTWAYDAGTLTISFSGSGTGAMADYDDQPWKDYRSSITSVVIEDGVTSIGQSAFYDCRLTSITIPASVTTIGKSAFYGCKLTSITLNEGLTTINEEAFSNNGTTIGSVSIPQSVTSIGNNAFIGTNVANFYINNIPSKITIGETTPFKISAVIHVFTLMNGIFENATNWSEYKGHFVGDIGITHVESVTLDNMVDNMVVLTGASGQLNATINPADARVKDVVFTSSNDNLVQITNAATGEFKAGSQEGTATITCTAMDGTGSNATCTVQVKSELTPAESLTLNMSENSLNVGEQFTLTAEIAPTDATYQNITWCTSDETVATVINGTVTAVAPGMATITAISGDGQARANCVVTVVVASGNCGTDVTWTLTGTSPDYTLTISGTGDMADYIGGEQPWESYLSEITSVVIEDGVTSIGDYAFMNTAATVYVLPSTPPTLGEDAFNMFNGTIYVHGDEYDSADGWTGLSKTKIYAVSFSDGATTSTDAIISDATSDYYTEGTSIKLGHDGNPPTGYEFGYTVKDAADNDITSTAISEDQGVYTLTMPAGDATVTAWKIISFKIDYITYESTTDGTTVKVARYNGTSSSLVIPERVEYNHVSYYVTEIGEGAFKGNEDLERIDMPNIITVIGRHAFKDCTGLSKIITIPASLRIIEEEAFSGCNLTEFTSPEGLTTIEDYAFSDCSNLTSVTFSESVTDVGENAFENCDEDLIIYVPEGRVDDYRSRWPDLNILAIGTIPIPYIAADGSKAYCTDYTVLNGSNEYTVIDSPGWYVVNSDISYEKGLTFDVENGDVNLILCDDAEMSIEVRDASFALYVNGNSFNIFGQSGGTGKLTTSADNDYGINAVNCDMTINGGTISASGRYKGIYASKCNVTINSGSVTATATEKDPNDEEKSIGIKVKGKEGNTNYGNITINGGIVKTTGKDTGISADKEIIISGGGIEATGQNTGIFAGSDITISGGSVEVTGGSYGISNYEGDVNIVGGVVTVSGSDGISIDGNITLGWSNASDRITVSSFAFWGDITIINGQSFYNGEIIIPTDITGKVTDRVNLEGKTLIGVDVLNDAAENDIAALKTRLDGKETNVVLNGRTLTKDGNWNTLCLPFDLGDPNATTNHWFDDTPLEGATVMTLGNSQACNTGLNAQTGTLNLEFLPADCIEAGVPYIVKWTKPSTYVPYVDPDTNLDAYNAWLAADPANRDIHNPVFTGVTVSSDEPAAVTSYDNKVTFVGQYSPFSIVASGATGDNQGNLDEIIMLGSGSTLGYSKGERELRCFRAHFYVKADGSTQAARRFVMNTGEGTQTGICHTDLSDLTDHADAWYSLDGRKLNGQPTKKGVYIQNGKKVVIK